MKFDRYFIVFAMVLAAVVLSFFLSPIEAFTIIPILTFGFILLGKPRILLFLYIAFVAVQPPVQSLSGTVIKRVDDLLAALLWALFFALIAMRKLDMVRIKTWWRFAALLVGYAAFTFLLNRGSPRGAWQCFAIYLSVIPFFALCCNYLKPSDLKPVIAGTLAVFYISVLLNIGWFLRINPMPNVHLANNNMIDVALGVFGSCAKLSYFCIFLFFLVISLLRNLEIVGKKWKTPLLVALIVLMLQLYFTYTNHAYLFFAMAFIPFALISGTGKKWHFFVLVMIAFLVVNLLIASSEEWGQQFSSETLRYRYDELANSAKIQLFGDLLIKNLHSNPMEWLMGVGPGNGMGAIGKDNLTPFALRMLLNYYQAFDMHAMQMTSITGNTSSAVFAVWGDFGLIGFSFFVAMYGVVFKKCVDVIRLKSSLQKRVVAEALIGILVMFALVNVVMDVLYSIFITKWIWMLIAFLYLPDGNKKSEEAILVQE